MVSYLLGAVVWLFSAGVTFTMWGWGGLVLGLLILGVGVIPMAILAAFLNGESSLAVTTIVLVALTWGARIGGARAVAPD